MKAYRAIFLTLFFLSACGFASAQSQSAQQSQSTQRGVFDAASKPSTPEQPGPYYALVIGINDYQHLTKLNSPLNDANEIASVLRDRYGFETTLLPNASRHDIISALDNYRRSLPDNSNLLIYYAGHGWYDDEMEEAYWAPAEAGKDTYADWIIADEITSRARAIPARHILIVSDSCYSGMLSATREDSPNMTPLRRGPYLDKCLRKKSRAVISSGGNEPVADAGAPGHSIFTYAFLEGLKEIEWDEFSANDLFEQYLKVQVAGNSNQLPTFKVIANSGDNLGDFVFSRLPASVATRPAAAAGGGAQPNALLAQAKSLFSSGEHRQAYPLFQQAAEAGSAEAMVFLGTYADSTQPAYANVAKNDTVAAAWYRKAAEAGDARGMANLGVMYANGRGVPQDDAQAVNWYRKAAEAGDADGMTNLGWMYQNGRGVARDDAQAVNWYRQSAEAGSPHGMANLGWMYWNGAGVTKDDVAAIGWYRKAADAGDADGMTNLGWMYENGIAVAKDEAQAVNWYRKAAEAGEAHAMSNLGSMYRDGKGTAKDDAEAVKWYRKAAEGGDADGMSNLGWMYQNGFGVPQDDTAALTWYRKAAEAGNPPGLRNVGWMYENGRGVPKDQAEALNWYRKAAASGDEWAQNRLKELGAQ